MALRGISVVEFSGLAPGPFAGLILADFGASVIRIDHAGNVPYIEDVLCRGKRSLAVNLKSKSGYEVVKRLISQADVLIDPFRPGALEKLGLGPDEFLGKDGLNPRLVYGRIAGFSPHDHQGKMAGHDINYLAQSGLLSLLPPRPSDSAPTFPLNLLADFAGGGLMLALGVMAALHERSRSSLGQVVSADMVNGSRYLGSFPLIHAAESNRTFVSSPPGNGLLDGGAPFYSTYACQDGKFMSIGCLEPKFYAQFLLLFKRSLPPDSRDIPSDEELKQSRREHWPKVKEFFARGFMTRKRDDWGRIFAGTDCCAVPILSPEEAAAATSTHHPAPHPILSRTPAVPAAVQGPVVLVSGAHTKEILSELGYSEEEQNTFIGMQLLDAKL